MDEEKVAAIKNFPIDDSNLPFLLTVDTCAYGIGGYIAQIVDKIEWPIAYFSRVLRDAEKRYSTYEKETLAIKYGIISQRKYIYGTKCFIFTDHRPLVSFKKADKNSRVQRWRMELAEYDFEIFY